AAAGALERDARDGVSERRCKRGDHSRTICTTQEGNRRPVSRRLTTRLTTAHTSDPPHYAEITSRSPRRESVASSRRAGYRPLGCPVVPGRRPHRLTRGRSHSCLRHQYATTNGPARRTLRRVT